VGVVSIQIVKNFVAAGIYLLLRLLLQTAQQQTRRSIIRVRNLRILLSLFAIPVLTFLYVDDIRYYLQYYPMVIPPFPAWVYFACLAWLVIDVLREYNGLIKAERWTSEEDTIESSRD
jgi:hypothetical protein